MGFDLEAIAACARDVNAKLVWICDPNNPTGLRLGAGEWSDFLDALPEYCVVVADEAYVDYIEPASRIDRLADIRAGRPVIVLRTFSKIFGLGRREASQSSAGAGRNTIFLSSASVVLARRIEV